MKALHIKDVVSKVSLGQSTIYRMVAQGTFPRPFPLAANRVGWVESEIDEWLAQRAATRVIPGVKNETGVKMGVSTI